MQLLQAKAYKIRVGYEAAKHTPGEKEVNSAHDDSKCASASTSLSGHPQGLPTAVGSCQGSALKNSDVQVFALATGNIWAKIQRMQVSIYFKLKEAGQDLRPAAKSLRVHGFCFLPLLAKLRIKTVVYIIQWFMSFVMNMVHESGDGYISLSKCQASSM